MIGIPNLCVLWQVSNWPHPLRLHQYRVEPFGFLLGDSAGGSDGESDGVDGSGVYNTGVVMAIFFGTDRAVAVAQRCGTGLRRGVDAGG